jgi:hypothetical protein
MNENNEMENIASAQCCKRKEQSAQDEDHGGRATAAR